MQTTISELANDEMRTTNLDAALWSVPALRALRIALFGIIFKLAGLRELIPRGEFSDLHISLSSGRMSSYLPLTRD